MRGEDGGGSESALSVRSGAGVPATRPCARRRLDPISPGTQIRLLQEHGLRFLLAALAQVGDHPHLQAQLDRADAP